MLAANFGKIEGNVIFDARNQPMIGIGPPGEVLLNLRKELTMAMVVTEPCFGCKYTDCVTVCPADCFYEGESMLFIHPDECIDCGACVPECPPQAIYYEDDVPEKWRDYIALNREMAPQCPNITEKKAPLC